MTTTSIEGATLAPPSTVTDAARLHATSCLFAELAGQADTIFSLMITAVEALGDTSDPDCDKACGLLMAMQELAQRMGALADIGSNVAGSPGRRGLLAWSVAPATLDALRRTGQA